MALVKTLYSLFFFFQAGSSQKEAHLENVCKSLQQQVSQLQEVLTSVSNYVFQGGTNDDLGNGLLYLFIVDAY